MAKPVIEIIIPTFNNPEYFNPCIGSILNTGVLKGLAHLTVVNNGNQPIDELLSNYKNEITVLKPKENLGWEGGLKLAMEQSDSKFVCFQNDDTLIPIVSKNFYQQMLVPFIDKTIAAVGPVTTTASGIQSIFNSYTPTFSTDVSWMIFFTVMLRREDVMAVGGVDTSLPGGDDFDLSIRLRQAGKRLIVNPQAFIYHFGFKTGTRVYGDGYAGIKDGWNSPEMIERVQKALIQKHGFKTWFKTIHYQIVDVKTMFETGIEDSEGKIIKEYIGKEDKVIELGCGAKKTVDWSVGVDIVPKGESIKHVAEISKADVVADVTKPMDIKGADVVVARHILEHCLDTIGVIENWKAILKDNGLLIIAVPDEEIITSIPLNPEHCHAFTEKSLKAIMEKCGFKEVESRPCGNGVSFIGVYKKLPVVAGLGLVYA